MEYFAAHPTTFRNVNYRSRLEAKWASFFTDLGWEFQYEPFDLKGWVPDFEIKTKTDKRLLVEIKPVMFINGCLDFNDPYVFFEHEETFAKALNYADQFRILLIGTGLFSTSVRDVLYIDENKKFSRNVYSNILSIGILAGAGCEWGQYDYAVLKDRYDFSPERGSWVNWINNNESRDFLSKRDHPEIEGFWADAHNNTKFDAFRYYNGFKYPGS